MSACPLLSESTQPPVLALRKHGYDIFRCPGCGVGRVRVEAFRPEQYYDEACFNSQRDGACTDYTGSEVVLRHEFREQLNFPTGFVPGSRLLEIGCAYGFFLGEAKQRFEVFGVEVAPAAVHDPLVTDWPETGLTIDSRLESLAASEAVAVAVRRRAYLDLDAAAIVALFPRLRAVANANAVLIDATARALAGSGIRVAGVGKGHWRHFANSAGRCGDRRP